MLHLDLDQGAALIAEIIYLGICLDLGQACQRKFALRWYKA